VTEASTFGSYYTFDDAAQLNGNDVLSINQNGNAPCCTGITVLARVSNGENGIEPTVGGPDIDNSDPADAVFTTIGNPSGRLEDGNVIRLSAWFRSDPSNPITLDPQVQPVLKVELWKEALSGDGDFSAPIPHPNFGDRLFDQDQQHDLLDPVDKAQWIDFDGDGIAGDALAQPEGRVSSISTTAWTLVESTYKVDAVNHFLGIGGVAFGAGDVTVIESIVATMFLGDFANTDLTGDGNGGNLLMDNLLVEVFKDQASVTANTNPNPEGVAGDYNHNGKVDAADYVLWRNGDSPDDSPAGYNLWKANFGNPPGSGSGLGSSAVPEPSSLVLACLTMLAAGQLRRRTLI
jgi:hypothetical protein